MALLGLNHYQHSLAWRQRRGLKSGGKAGADGAGPGCLISTFQPEDGFSTAITSEMENHHRRKRPPLLAKGHSPGPPPPHEILQARTRNERWNILAQLKTPPTFRDVGKGKISKQAQKQNHSSLFSPLKRIRQRHSTLATHCSRSPCSQQHSCNRSPVASPCTVRAQSTGVCCWYTRLPGNPCCSWKLLGENTAHQ